MRRSGDWRLAVNGLPMLAGVARSYYNGNPLDEQNRRTQWANETVMLAQWFRVAVQFLCYHPLNCPFRCLGPCLPSCPASHPCNVQEIDHAQPLGVRFSLQLLSTERQYHFRRDAESLRTAQPRGCSTAAVPFACHCLRSPFETVSAQMYEWWGGATAAKNWRKGDHSPPAYLQNAVASRILCG